ncbi:hypothetical protein B0T26DRAFT_859874 [Lasiosphaeria miniovina]|uniref:Uncharacterized protein n=1 Tax=Lasiosphaeria miniovina TaxID=1954250 RepID=A0AA40A4Q9_9PEZI|nr:uncharacterized protein B0T26DRAFT_859874 [Lasiosphaeria miniovina]KAK0709227.1 hypothetical protein B0T26DRAFT_859874 [Lasiosphaeria miniovina]
MMGQETEDEKWLFLGGIGMSSRHCHHTTLPALSRLFSRPMTCICMPTYGLPLDLAAVMLQRCLAVPSAARRTLYAQLRSAVLDDSLSRVVVLAQNHGAVLAAQAVAQLCADVPADKLRKLEVYTFGAAAAEFVLPLGEDSNSSGSNEPALHHHQPADAKLLHERRGVHVEHFALVADPFAQMGVLQSVRMNMEGRFCGGVFIVNDVVSPSTSTSTTTAAGATPQKQPGPAGNAMKGMMMEDYMLALFPGQMAMLAAAGAGGKGAGAAVAGRRSVLDSVMTIDRDCAEKREIAAITNYYAASRKRKDGASSNGNNGKRLSWTGLAATTAGQHKNGVSAGMEGLEMARKGCKNCDGHKGRDVSWLVRYACADPMDPMAMHDAKQVPYNYAMGMGMIGRL